MQTWKLDHINHRGRGKNINLDFSSIKDPRTINYYLATETSGCLESHPISFAILGYLYLSYKPRLCGRLFSETGCLKDCSTLYWQSLPVAFPLSCKMSAIFFYAEGILKDYPAFLLQSSTVFFFLCSATFPVFTACCQQSRKEQFLFPMANFATMNQIPYRVLSMFIFLLLRKLVLPGADLSHCHEEP